MSITITRDLTTKVRNISTKTLSMGCLPRSKRMASGAEHTINGCLLSLLQGNTRKLEALHRALYVDRVLAIVHSPNPHLYDSTLDHTKVLSLDNGTLGVADPSWGAYSSSIDSGEDAI